MKTLSQLWCSFPMFTAASDARVAFNDVRNLLLAIESQAAAALARLEVNHPTRTAIGAIRSSARRATAAVDSVARGGQTTTRRGEQTAVPPVSPPMVAPAVIDISAVLEGMAPVVEEQMGDIAHLAVRLPAVPAIVDANPVDIERALFEVVGALGTAMYHPGVLRVAGRVVALPGEPVSADRRVVEIELQADGRTLTTVETADARALAEQNGGRLLLEDHAGLGSSVRLMLPARAAGRSQAEP
jgi:hypothetical protein